jgi:hypothetical protein
MTNKKTAYYQFYDPSVLEMPEYCVREDMCDDIASLEDDIFQFGKDMIRLSKSLEGMEKSDISSKIQSIVSKYCEDYLESDDSISNLDDYDALALYEDEDEDEDEDEED